MNNKKSGGITVVVF